MLFPLLLFYLILDSYILRLRAFTGNNQFMLRQRFLKFYQNNPLAIKLLASIILCSSLITLIATIGQLYLDYRYERTAINERIQQIESTSLPSLANSLWEISPKQVQLQLEGINQIPDVEFITLDTPYNEHYKSGKRPLSSILEKQYNITHTEDGKEYPLGVLKLIISLDHLYQRLWDKAFVILLSQGVKTFLVSVFILSIFYHLVTQHLSVLANYARKLSSDKLNTPLVLNREDNNKPDELNEVVTAMNSMRQSMLNDFEKRETAEAALETLNRELEERVLQRTIELKNANNELNNTLLDLKQTQQQLVQSEKMAALGNLVAGVAHEISTPIGIGYTAASFLEQQSQQQTGEFADLAVESSQMIRHNLERAAQLVTAFKQVSVDQANEQLRSFNVSHYLQEILLSLKPRLREINPKITVSCPDRLVITSYPGCYYQIFNNLIINSLIHGYSEGRSLDISIDISQRDDEMVINYTDNGKGVHDDIKSTIFEPFVTSKRSSGCTGLGMHITYNLVNQLLKGRINYIDSNSGAHFIISAPII